MLAEPDISEIAALMGEPSRAAMLVALLGKDALPATELAHKARVSPQTASSHLAKLVAGNLLAVERHGRHRYYRLASDQVGRFIETLASLAPPPRVSSLMEMNEEVKAIRYARTCYDHLAGKVAVEIARAMVGGGWLKRAGRDFEVTAAGERRLGGMGIRTEDIRQGRRAFALQCLDWSERQHHIAGALGAALLDRMLMLKWVARTKDTRCVRVTLEGRKALHRLFKLRV
ncbi:MAG TPA: winged helix-turn-helix domain-containing protein [Pyrinomonadaceae bacterium]|nr:winged helix-turn-helix domain-containing protein [Pyrinomonadaceae bacterium]